MVGLKGNIQTITDIYVLCVFVCACVCVRACVRALCFPNDKNHKTKKQAFQNIAYFSLL